MPKVNLKRDAPLDDAARKIYEYFKANKTEKQVCSMMGYGHDTFHRRSKQPGHFTLEELRIMAKDTKLPDEVFMNMIREAKA